MRKTILPLLLCFGIMFPYSCMTDPSGEKEDNSDTIAAGMADTTKRDTVFTLKAKFVSFELGDASHFSFEDKTGNIFDFGGNESKEYQFESAVSSDKQNEENQGWTTNPELKGKWFNLKYIYRNQPQYQDGPTGRVPVIIEATLVSE